MLRDAGVAQHVAYALQLALGGVFLASCAGKLRRPRAFVRTVADYRVLPRVPALERAVAVAVIALEAFLAVTFLTGWLLTAAIAVGAAVLLAFGAGVTINLRRGRTISCGCFGSQGEFISGQTVVRIGVLLGAVATAGALLAATRAIPVTVADVADDPRYLPDAGGLAVVLALTTVWALNARSVLAVFSSFRREAQA